ncbi:Flagellar hook-length control protein FliK [anaerobic digester metagenome]
MNNVTVQPQQFVTLSAGSPSALQNTLTGLNATGLHNVSASFLDLLTSVLGAGGETALTAQLKKNVETLGAQMNAEMLTVNPLLSLMVSGQTTPTDPAALQQTAASDALGQIQSLALAADVQLPSELLSQLQDAIDSVQTPASANTTAFSAFAAALQASNSNLNTTAITGVFSNSASDSASAFQAQSQFGRAVSQVQLLLQATGSADTAELDLEDLQKKVDSGAFLPRLSNAAGMSTPAAAAEVGIAPDARDISNQIKSAVTRYTQDGATDFTIKLSPEGLGEITVKLLESGGKITLSLAASDAGVQRLLGSELNHLCDIMRPYNVEVAQVIQSNEAQSMNMQQQFGQQLSQHSYSGQQQAPTFAYDADYGESAQTGKTEQAAIPLNSMLDTYI